MNATWRISVVLAVIFACGSPVSAGTISVVGTTGIYDENAVATNTVDVELGTKSLAQFKTDVLAAYNVNAGGVIDWETGVTSTASVVGASNNSLQNINVAYGASATESLSIGFGRQMELYTNNVAGQVSVVSAETDRANSILVGNSGDARAFTMTFAGADLTEVGATLLSRTTFTSGGDDVTVTANLSGGSSLSLNTTIGKTAGADDTFFYFAASEGETIDSLTFTNNTTSHSLDLQARLVLDDFGFVATAVPEPSSLVLGIAGLLGLAWYGWRRR